jgi:fibrillarin-like pre-rRNA processing protein
MIWKDGILCTTGKPVKGDRVFGQLRVWPPERSKLAALYHLGSVPAISRTDSILYLGAAAGTTVSFLADYAGVIYAVERATDPLPRLLEICRVKKNIIPIPADASTPEQYAPFVSFVDVLYQDVAQRNQTDIAVRNLIFLRKGGYLILMLKTRSVSTQDDAKKICERAVKILRERYMEDISVTWLDTFHRGHACIICKKGNE